MNLINHKKCDICGSIYDTSSFANMMGNGCNSYSRIVIYGNAYDCCPECTNEIYNFLIKLNTDKSNKNNQ